MVWYVWKCRSKLVFDGIDKVLQLSSRVCSVTDAYWIAQEKLVSIIIQADQRPKLLNYWSMPLMSWVKKNVDGCFKGNSGPAEGGGLLRKSDGSLIRWFMLCFGVCKALAVEL